MYRGIFRCGERVCADRGNFAFSESFFHKFFEVFYCHATTELVDIDCAKFRKFIKGLNHVYKDLSGLLENLT